MICFLEELSQAIFAVRAVVKLGLFAPLEIFNFSGRTDSLCSQVYFFIEIVEVGYWRVE